MPKLFLRNIGKEDPGQCTRSVYESKKASIVAALFFGGGSDTHFNICLCLSQSLSHTHTLTANTVLGKSPSVQQGLLVYKRTVNAQR